MTKIDKFLKIIWAINGVIFLVFVYFSIFPRISYLFKSRPDLPPEGIIVGVKQDTAAAKGIRLQRIIPAKPEIIEKSGYYFIPLSQHDLQKPVKNRKRLIELRVNLNVDSNILFIKLDGTEEHLLFDQSMGISKFFIPESGNRIYYFVYENDTNNDGRINQLDRQFLWSSDLSGKSLKKIDYENCSLEYYYQNDGSDFIYLQYIYDQNMDGDFTEADYIILKKLHLNSGAIEDVIKIDSMIEIHQKLFD